MNCLIFGASGLIGSHLKTLLCQAYNVVTVGRQQEDTFPLDLERDWLSEGLPRDINSVIYLAQSEKFRDFPDSAESMFRVNSHSLLKALEYARQVGAHTFIYASSGGVYDGRGSSFNEFSEESPVYPYGELGFYYSTKICGEMIAQSYTPYMKIVILRPFFVYGPGQRKDMLIPKLVEKVRNSQSIHIAGEEGLYLNPIYVEDAARAIHKALTINTSEIVNIAGSEILSMRKIGEEIGQALCKEVRFEQATGPSVKLVGRIEKMTELLGKPSVSFSNGLKMYIDFLKKTNSDYG